MKLILIKRLSFLLIFLGLTIILSRTSITSQNVGEEAISDERIVASKLKEGVFLEINLPATRLEFYVNGQLQKSYPIAIGMDIFPTPIRTFHISQIIWNPWWIPPDSDWAVNDRPTPPGPENPLGPVKMLMDNGVRIHGTSQPNSIGNAASHSCIRMYSEDAIELAWEIQKRYSSQNNPQFLETYKTKTDETFYVGLSRSIPVFTKYQQVELSGDTLVIHPDRYGRGGFRNELEIALAGRSDVHLDQELIEKLNEMRAQQTVEINLNELDDLGKEHKKSDPKAKRNWRERRLDKE